MEGGGRVSEVEKGGQGVRRVVRSWKAPMLVMTVSSMPARAKLARTNKPPFTPHIARVQHGASAGSNAATTGQGKRASVEQNRQKQNSHLKPGWSSFNISSARGIQAMLPQGRSIMDFML